MNGGPVPVLETVRTVLRGWREEDLDPYAAMDADPEVMRFLGGVRDRAQAWRGMAMFAGWSEVGAAHLISLIDLENGRSRRVAERLGMAVGGEHVLDGTPVLVYGIDRPTAG